jgi:hypothetical protein
MAEAEFVVAAFVVEGILRVRRVLRHLEAVRRRAHPDHRSAALQVVIEVLHLLRREVLEAQEHDREVGGVQRFDARHVRLVAGDDLTRLGINAKEHRAFETLVLRQDTSQLRQRLLGAILMVIRHEDDVLAFARPFGAFVNEWSSRREGGEREQSEEDVFHAVERTSKSSLCRVFLRQKRRFGDSIPHERLKPDGK